VARVTDAATLESLERQLEGRLKALFVSAREALQRRASRKACSVG
jgi:hypothetical protein